MSRLWTPTITLCYLAMELHNTQSKTSGKMDTVGGIHLRGSDCPVYCYKQSPVLSVINLLWWSQCPQKQG